MNRIWTDEEVSFLSRHAASMFDEEVAAALTRMSGREVTLAAVRRRRQKLGLRKRRGRGLTELEAATPP